MFLRRNIANQTFTIPGSLRAVADGSAVTSATIFIQKDGTDAAGAGTLAHLRDGCYKYTPTQGETDCAILGYNLTGTGAVALSGSIRTTGGDPNDSAGLGLSRIDAAISTRSSHTAAAVQALVAAGSVASVTGNVGGNVSGSVGSVTGNILGNVAGSIGSIAAGGITANSFAGGAINASALASDAASEIAAAVETAILNEADLSAVLEAIRLKIEESDDDLTTAAIATAVWGYGGGRTLSSFAFGVTVTTNNDKTGYSLADGSIIAATYGTAPAWYAAPDNSGIDAIETVASRIDSAMELDIDVYRFTQNALEQAPAFAGGDPDGVTTLLQRIPGTVQPQTGDSFARLGAPVNGSISADIAGVLAVLPRRVRKNTALANFAFPMVLSSDHATLATGLTVTAQRSIDGAAFSNCVNSVTEVGSGVYKINLDAADLNGDVIFFKFAAATADARMIEVVTQL
jgi:hypothetical protein